MATPPTDLAQIWCSSVGPYATWTIPLHGPVSISIEATGLQSSPLQGLAAVLQLLCSLQTHTMYTINQ